MKLNIGAGNNQKPPEEGWVNIDAQQWDGIDLVIDLEDENLPYDNNSVEQVNMQDFLEHIGKFRQLPFLKDLYRVMKPGAEVFIQIPDLESITGRYCGSLENPFPNQTPMNCEQLAAALYGGQEYGYNFHKWGYDAKQLTIVLECVGFVVRDAHSDGGSNLLCWAVKPYESIVLPVGGGIGDILQIYLAEVSSRRNYEIIPGEISKPPPDEFPTSNVDSSLWFRRLHALKAVYPHIKVKVAVTSTNSVSAEIFEHNPYIDVVEILDKAPSDWYHHIDADGFMHVESSELIHTQFPPEPPKFYMDEEEQRLLEVADNLGKYIVIHPYAGAVERVVISERFCRKLIDRLIDDCGYHVIVVGKRSVFDGVRVLPESFMYRREGLTSLVNMISINASAQLVLGASGFVGMHSCMILCAWFARIPTVCLVPPEHDGGQPWEEFFADENNPTTWGARQPFNRTITVPERDSVDIDEIVIMLKEGGLV